MAKAAQEKLNKKNTGMHVKKIGMKPGDIIFSIINYIIINR